MKDKRNIINNPTAKRLSPDKWGEIKAAYLAGKDKVADIAKKYGITRDAIFKAAKREAWGTYGSFKEAIREEATKKVTADLIDKHAEIIRDANDAHIEDFERLREAINNNIKYSDTIIRNKLAKLEKDKITGRLIIPNDFSIAEEQRAIGFLGNQLIKAIMEGIRPVLGIEDKTIVGETQRKSGTAELVKWMGLSIDAILDERAKERAGREAELKA